MHLIESHYRSFSRASQIRANRYVVTKIFLSLRWKLTKSLTNTVDCIAVCSAWLYVSVALEQYLFFPPQHYVMDGHYYSPDEITAANGDLIEFKRLLYLHYAVYTVDSEVDGRAIVENDRAAGDG